MRALLRSPLLHFLVLGTLVYVLQGASETPTEADAVDRVIAIDPARMAELRTTFTEQMGRGPNEIEVARMIDAEVEEEILFREAVARGLLERDGGVQTRLIQKMLFLEGEATIDEAPDLLARAVELGLHREDIVVRRILIQKMRLLGGRLRDDQAVTESDVATRYADRRESFRAPDRMSLSHVFVSRDRPGGTREAATALLTEIGGVPPDEGPSRGDPFPLGHRLPRRSRHDLERTFGARFGAALFSDAPPTVGEWSGPVESAYGYHLVFVEALESGEVPGIEVVSDRLRLEIEEERREANLEALLSDLRTRYRVRTPSAVAAPPALRSGQETG